MPKPTSTSNRAIKEKPDKSADFKEIFNRIKQVMKCFTPPFKVITDNEKSFEMVSDKEIVFMGRKRENVYFAATKIQKTFVGFHLMHIYAQPSEIDRLGKDLKKLLKGKSCFQIKKVNDDLLHQIKESLEQGIDCYKRLKFL